MKVIDLRPDSKLLKPNFDGYKLSLERIPILKIENINKPKIVQQCLNNEYSFHHSTLFQMHNFLIPDPWNFSSAYYIDSTFGIQKIQYDHKIGKLKPLSLVYKDVKIDLDQQKEGGVYNSEMKFISEKYALISCGTGNLFIIDTGDRLRSDEWKKIDSLKPLDGNAFILQDAKLTFEKGVKTIHCLLLHIEQIDDKFYNIVDWITLQDAGNKKWQSVEKRRIQGIVYSSTHNYKFIYDSVNEIVEEIPMNVNEVLQAEDLVNKFQWTQKGKEITICFMKISEAKDQYDIKCLQSHIEIKWKDEVLLNSDLFAEIDVESTTWTIENDCLELNLIKKVPELIWPYLIPNGPLESTNNKNENFLASQPVADLNSQIEECDLDGQGTEEYFIEHLDSISHNPLHKIFLGSNHPLFSKTLRPGAPKALAIRNDVDCCLWLQEQITPDAEWSLKHQGTLNAFSYVSASKRDKKYLTCSSDLNIAIVAESCRHLFIYKSSYSTASGLRKRTGQQLEIGQQKLVTLDGKDGEILGINIDIDIAIILTENAILCLQLGDPE